MKKFLMVLVMMAAGSAYAINYPNITIRDTDGDQLKVNTDGSVNMVIGSNIDMNNYGLYDVHYVTATALSASSIKVDAVTVQDASANGVTFSTNVIMGDNGTIGLGVGKGRIEFDDQSTDEVNILNANVGIGTANPSATLNVEGSVIFNDLSADYDFRVESNGNANALVVDGGTDDVIVGHSSAKNDGFTVVGSDSDMNKITIESYDDNNTNSPATIRLQKSDADTRGLLQTTNDGELYSSISSYGVGSSSTVILGALIRTYQDGSATATRVPTNMFLETYSNSALNTAQLVLHNDGNVGIGTASPTSKLDVVGGIGLYSRTEAELKAITPAKAGIVYYDSTNFSVVVSTGTGVAAFGMIYNGALDPTGW